jgi:hypothetical protein
MALAERRDLSREFRVRNLDAGQRLASISVELDDGRARIDRPDQKQQRGNFQTGGESGFRLYHDRKPLSFVIAELSSAYPIYFENETKVV